MDCLTQPINQEAATLASKLLNHEFVIAEYKDQHQTFIFLECAALNLSLEFDNNKWIANTMSGDPIFSAPTLEELTNKLKKDIALNEATAITIEARRALSDLNSDYNRRMGSLGYHRVAVGEEYPTYWWSKDCKESSVPFLDMIEDSAIICPFQ